MCTSIVEVVGADGAGKGGDGWFDLTHSVVSYDHPHHALLEEAITIDFVNAALGPGARVAVELTLRVERPHRGGHQQDHRGGRHARGHECALPRCGRGRAGAVSALLRPRHHRVDHVSQDGRRAVTALPLHPDGPAEFFEDGPDRLPRGGARGAGAHRSRVARRTRHPAGILGRQFAGRAVGDGGRHHLPRAGRQVRDGRLAYRYRGRPVSFGQSPLGGQPGPPARRSTTRAATISGATSPCTSTTRAW
jgi:hypothetical protein